jgi:hypothetical protein
MNEAPDLAPTLPVAHLVGVLRALWWLPAAAAVIGAIGAFASVEARAASYTSSAEITLVINPLLWHTNLSLYKPVDPGAMDHEILLADGVEADRRVGRQLGIPPAAVGAAVTVVPIGDQSLKITATSTSHSLVAHLLPAVLDAYRASRRAELSHALSVHEDALRTTLVRSAGARAAVDGELARVAELRRLLPSGVNVTRGPTPVTRRSRSSFSATALGTVLGALIGATAALLLGSLPGVEERRRVRA